MNEIVKSGQAELIRFLHNDSSLQPYRHDLQLMETYVAGLSQVPGIIELFADLHVGDTLQLLREPENPHDHDAVFLVSADDRRAGYLPRHENKVIARLLDGGRNVHARITKLSHTGSRFSMEIEILLSD